MTDDPDIRIASSLMDYLFRRLAIEYLTTRSGTSSASSPSASAPSPPCPGSRRRSPRPCRAKTSYADPPSVESASTLAAQMDLGMVEPKPETPAPTQPAAVSSPDAPMCMQCGIQMQRAGSCHACPSCGTTSGCS